MDCHEKVRHRSLMPRNRCPDLFLYCHLRTTLAERWKMDSVAVFSSPITYFVPLLVNPLVYTATKVPLEFTVISSVCIWNHVCRGHVCLEILSRLCCASLGAVLVATRLPQTAGFLQKETFLRPSSLVDASPLYHSITCRPQSILSLVFVYFSNVPVARPKRWTEAKKQGDAKLFSGFWFENISQQCWRLSDHVSKYTQNVYAYFYLN